MVSNQHTDLGDWPFNLTIPFILHNPIENVGTLIHHSDPVVASPALFRPRL